MKEFKRKIILKKQFVSLCKNVDVMNKVKEKRIGFTLHKMK